MEKEFKITIKQMQSILNDVTEKGFIVHDVSETYKNILSVTLIDLNDPTEQNGHVYDMKLVK
jgi:hypothetical protein